MKILAIRENKITEVPFRDLKLFMAKADLAKTSIQDVLKQLRIGNSVKTSLGFVLRGESEIVNNTPYTLTRVQELLLRSHTETRTHHVFEYQHPAILHKCVIVAIAKTPELFTNILTYNKDEIASYYANGIRREGLTPVLVESTINEN